MKVLQSRNRTIVLVALAILGIFGYQFYQAIRNDSGFGVTQYLQQPALTVTTLVTVTAETTTLTSSTISVSYTFIPAGSLQNTSISLQVSSSNYLYGYLRDSDGKNIAGKSLTCRVYSVYAQKVQAPNTFGLVTGEDGRFETRWNPNTDRAAVVFFNGDLLYKASYAQIGSLDMGQSYNPGSFLNFGRLGLLDITLGDGRIISVGEEWRGPLLLVATLLLCAVFVKKK